MIYIPQLWKTEKDDDQGDYVNRAGDAMTGTLDMSFNKIINLSNLTDPDQNDACSYDIMKDT